MSRNQVRDVLGLPADQCVPRRPLGLCFTIGARRTAGAAQAHGVILKTTHCSALKAMRCPVKPSLWSRLTGRPKSNKPAPSLQADEATLQAVAASDACQQPSLDQHHRRCHLPARNLPASPLPEAASAAPSAWDAPTQRAAAAATATRAPSTPPGNAPRNSAVSVVGKRSAPL